MLKLDFPFIQVAARLLPSHRTLRYGDTEANEKIYWSDPNLASVLPLPTIRGNLHSALERPGCIVLTQRMARKSATKQALPIRLSESESRGCGRYASEMRNILEVYQGGRPP